MSSIESRESVVAEMSSFCSLDTVFLRIASKQSSQMVFHVGIVGTAVLQFECVDVEGTLGAMAFSPETMVSRPHGDDSFC